MLLRFSSVSPLTLPAARGLPFLGPRIVERRTRHLRRSQAPQHQADRTELQHARARIGSLLIILAVATVTTQPGKRPLHHPPNLHRLESHRVGGPTTDLHLPAAAAVHFQPLLLSVIMIFI